MPNRKKPELQRKTHNMKIRLDDIQYSTIQMLAEEAGMTMTEYIRHQAVHGKYGWIEIPGDDRGTDPMH